jgi:hypothetical protein
VSICWFVQPHHPDVLMSFCYEHGYVYSVLLSYFLLSCYGGCLDGPFCVRIYFGLLHGRFGQSGAFGLLDVCIYWFLDGGMMMFLLTTK